MHRTAPWFAWLPLGLGLLVAQERPARSEGLDWRRQLATEVRAQLQATDLALVACGARAAADCGLRDCVPALRSRLFALRGLAGVAWECAVESLLDALIETGASVPAAELAPFAAIGDAVVVLAARDPAAHRRLLLQLFRPEQTAYFTDHRQACGNLLVALRDREFVRALLRGPIPVWVQVAHAGGDPEEVWGGGRGVSCGRFALPDGFPVIARVHLQTGPGDAEHLVAPGRVPVHRVRAWLRDGVHCSSFTDFEDYRLACTGWFEDLLGPQHRALAASVGAPALVTWQDLPSLQAAVERLRRERTERWRALAAACVEAGLVGADVAQGAPPDVKFLYLDSRSATDVKLPEDEWQPWK